MGDRVTEHRPKGSGLRVRLAVVVAALLALALSPTIAAAQSGSNEPERRVVLLGLQGRGDPAKLARQASDPSSPRYRHFASAIEFRRRFSAPPRDRRLVRRTLNRTPGVISVRMSSTRTVALAQNSRSAALREAIRQVSVGEIFRAAGRIPSREDRPERATGNDGTPRGCADAVATGGYLSLIHI